ncbi:MAG: metal-dependent hydrolase [Acidobacteriota bacterium]|nr:metal-dependent hydrolase [Acidobacteriota bacterium]
MDPFTQGALGAAAAQAIVGARLGRRAALVGMVGGALADADVVLRGLADPAFPVALHRHFTHALSFVPAGGLIAAAPFLRRPGERAAVIAAAMIAYATHPLLDACTSYGTLLYWPFSQRRVAWDVISIVDPVFTGILLCGVLASLKWRATGPARAALALCLAYLAIGGVQHARAAGAQEQLVLTRGHTVAEARVMPTLANLVVWRSVYRAGDTLYADAIRAEPLGRVTVSVGDTAPSVAESDLPTRAGRDERVRRVFRGFAWFAGGLTAVVSEEPLVVGDARYSLRTGGFEPLWGIEIVRGERDATVRWRNLVGEQSGSIGRLFDEILGTGGAVPRPLGGSSPPLPGPVSATP